MTNEEAFDTIARTYPYPALAAHIMLLVLESFTGHFRAIQEKDPERITDAHLQAIFTLAKGIGEAYTRAWSWLDIPWYDHRFDLLRGAENWAWLERCVFAMRHIRRGSNVLDLCCGDGFAAGCYYSRIAKHVDGLDKDPKAIELANRLYKRDNVEFYTLDVISNDFPCQDYDVVLFFAAIEHFSPEEGEAILLKVARCLNDGGVLFGSTPLSPGGKMHPNHKNEFTAPDDLHHFLAPYFEHVRVSALEWSPERTELYFTGKGLGNGMG